MLELVCEHNRKSISELNISSSSTSISAGTTNSNEPNTTKKKSRKSKTTRPRSSKERCSFRIQVYCSSKDCCWYLKSQSVDQHSASLHKGHLRMAKEHILSTLSELEEEDIDLALSCAELQLDHSTITHLLNQRSNNKGTKKFTSSQIRYAIDRATAEKLVQDSISTKSSSAENLINGFNALIRGGANISYVALLHDSLDGYIIKLPKGRPAKSRVPNCDDQFNIQEIRESMQLHQSQKLLLAFAFVSGEELRMLQKFPSLVTFDVTEKTNKEKRGLFVGTGIDGMGKILISLHCFMPNAQMSSYGWIYTVAIPHLWSTDIIQRCKVVVTDGEHALYHPLENLAATSSSWKGISVERCSWHLFTQEWSSIPIQHLDDSQKCFFGLLCDWINSWIFTIDHEYQFLDSLNRFKATLPVIKEKLGKCVHNRVRDLVGVMEHTSTKWAKCYKLPLLDLEQSTSSIGESINSSLKRFDKSRRMQLKTLAKSATTQIKHSEMLELKRAAEIARDMNRISVEYFISEQQLLSTHCQILAKEIFDRKKNYHWIRDGESSWMVCHCNAFARNDEESLQRWRFLPVYTNVHRLHMITTTRGKKFMYCKTCKKRARRGIPCVHITVITDTVHAQMFHPRYLLAYNSSLYEENAAIRGSIDIMMSENEMNPSYCDVSGIFNPDPFQKIVHSADVTMELFTKMKMAEKMHLQGKVLNRGQKPDDNSTDGTFICTDDDYCHVTGDEIVESEKQTRICMLDDGRQDRSLTNSMLHSYIQSFSKDILKEVDDDEESRKVVQDKLNSLLMEQKKLRLQRYEKGKVSNNTRGGIVSSSAETENSMKGRLKRKHEYFTKKK